MRCTRQVIFISDITVERFRIFSYINFIYPQMHPVGQEEEKKKKNENSMHFVYAISYLYFDVTGHILCNIIPMRKI